MNRHNPAITIMAIILSLESASVTKADMDVGEIHKGNNWSDFYILGALVALAIMFGAYGYCCLPKRHATPTTEEHEADDPLDAPPPTPIQIVFSPAASAIFATGLEPLNRLNTQNNDDTLEPTPIV